MGKSKDETSGTLPVSIELSSKLEWSSEQRNEIQSRKKWKERIGELWKPNKSEETEKRSQWGKQVEFFLSCIGYSVGLGNIWRFPYLCIKYGGGAFLVPYILYLFICGLSLFLLETAIGQSTGLSTIRIFNMIPFFQGLGWCMVMISAIVTTYFNILMAYIIYFLSMSFSWDLPWSHCNNTWNTNNCFVYQTVKNVTGIYNQSSNVTLPGKYTAAEEFWLYNALEISPSIEVIGGFQWKILFCFIAAWVLLFLCMFRGIKSTVKVVYLTATLPYVILTLMVIRGCTLPGAWNGLRYYLLPDWSRLADIEVWTAAAAQIFYTLGPAWGGLITFSSYNKYNHNIYRDAILIPLICGATSIYGGFAIYAVIGHLMYITGRTDTSEFMRQGPGLAFVVYPEALINLPGSAIWSVIFFLMLLTLGLDSQFGNMEVVVTGLSDQFPKSIGKHKMKLTLTICVVEFFIGLILTTRAGFYYFELFDTYTAAYSAVVIGFLEVMIIAYLYGANRLLDDIEQMYRPLGKWIRSWWLLTWYLLVPLMTLTIVVSTIVTHIKTADEKLAKFPRWAIIVGWSIACLSFIELPIAAVYAVYKHGWNWRKLFLPDENWHIQTEKRRIHAKVKRELLENTCNT